MTDEVLLASDVEMRNRSAEGLGLILIVHKNISYWCWDEDNPAIRCRDWIPDKDWPQAMMLWEHAAKDRKSWQRFRKKLLGHPINVFQCDALLRHFTPRQVAEAFVEAIEEGNDE